MLRERFIFSSRRDPIGKRRRQEVQTVILFRIPYLRLTYKGARSLHRHDKSGNESIGRYERKGKRVRGESLLRPPDKRNFTKVLGDRRKCEDDKIKIRPRVFYFHFDFSRHRDSSPYVVCVNPNNRSRQFMQLL